MARDYTGGFLIGLSAFASFDSGLNVVLGFSLIRDVLMMQGTVKIAMYAIIGALGLLTMIRLAQNN
jgi:hypothetical protein